ncbi:MAG: DNA ligase D [Opitutaceae bacterium]|nr:DNA ligase D [Cytophagales bacterium]
MSLVKYKDKRNFNETSEPAGETKKSQKELVFVIQRHQASHLHYDFRLEMEGVLKSWAVPKGPSLNSKDKRLAMMVEDHPYDYRTFEGSIPEGNYGAGVVEIWDEGTYRHITITDRKEGEKQLLKDLENGSVKIVMNGNKLKGEFALVKLKGSGSGRPENSWLLIKHNDEYATQEPYLAEAYTDPESKVSEEVERRTGKKVKIVKNVISKVAAKPAISPEPKKRNFRTAMAGLRSEKKFTDVITPMLAKQGENPFSDPDWVFEIKWDGYRAVAECKMKEIRLYSRNGLSFMNKYENVVAALEELKLDAILDGEVVVLDSESKPNFQLLQHYPDTPEDSTLMYYVFDILQFKDKDLYNLTLLERKEILKKLIPENSIIRYCDHVVNGGKEFFKWVSEQGLEGMMAKKADSLYYPGKRTTEWRKVRNHNMQEVVIGGFTEPQGGRKHFGSLVLGMYLDGKFIYVGNVGTGFDDKSLKELYSQMIKLKVEKSPFSDKVKDVKKVTFIEPELVCNIKFTEWTEERSLRHPVFMGIRVDKTAKEVIYNNETAAVASSTNSKSGKEKSIIEDKEPIQPEVKKPKSSANKETIVSVEGKELKLTNQSKIYFPDDNVTKGDVVKYYQSVAEYILPYLKDRPQSLKRNPNGIKDNGFFHKDAGHEAPEWSQSVLLYSESVHKDIDYLLCNDKATLMYMNNLGCIEINPWNSRTTNLENPDWMVIDIDPSDTNTFEQVIKCAQVTKAVLDKAGAESYCKTSGSTGLHVYVPMGTLYSYEQVKNFAHIIASLVHEQIPEFTTLERPLKKRNERMYIDYLQNREGQTLASAYSLRPKKGATVSTPLEWKEVKTGLSPAQFTIFNTMDRLKKKGDLFKGVLGKGIDMSNCLRKLEE